MKKLFIITLIAWMMFSCSSKPGFKISGEMENADGQMIKLLQRDGRAFVTVDSAIVKDGNFSLKGSVEYPDFYFIGLEGNENMKQFFLENSEITMLGNADSLDKVEISGSVSNEDYENYNWLMKPFDERMETLYQEYQQIAQSGDEAKMEELYEEYETIQDGIKSISMQFIKDNPGSFVSAGILGHLSYELDKDELDEMLGSLHDNVKVMPVIKQLEKRLIALKNTEIGKKAPDFELNDDKGNPVKLSDIIGAKLLLIDFWASWCNPCREENPNVVAVYNKYNEKGFDIIGVSLDNDKDSWLQGIEEDNLTWTHVSAVSGWDCPAADKYGVSSIPANFLLDENGIIIAKNLRGEDLGNKVQELLGE
ncbi:MAG: AhpC/TSA family protein [Candidatus Cloacimonetes bacterium]|nr:AhpC/TSA family protein [Candidatus Cloacimonadota bacterium]MCF7813541.1 AhpC/TSA family protein [Candidatus Cloacimonadota bacterium]MCF7869282.1 AhpC/TSA family protein [Candidatus Cloacimonadota bacterium]MCF7884195.1 AhpC/TSA family protein [Candidatus Cloacimonadota bacterium]